MAPAITLGRGNKRRIRQICWRPFEIVGAIALLLGTLFLSFLLTLWLVSHPFE